MEHVPCLARIDCRGMTTRRATRVRKKAPLPVNHDCRNDPVWRLQQQMESLQEGPLKIRFLRAPGPSTSSADGLLLYDTLDTNMPDYRRCNFVPG